MISVPQPFMTTTTAIFFYQLLILLPIWSYMNEKQQTDLLILRLAKKMIEKMEKTKNRFHHHDIKL